MKFIKPILNRFKEPSSWAAIAGALALAGIDAQAWGGWQYVVWIGAGAAGLLAVLLPEKAAPAV